MTIRFTCSNCESVLKIKDELAGTAGKCPKCKTRFTVPQPGEDSGVSPATSGGEDHPAAPDSSPSPPAESAPRPAQDDQPAPHADAGSSAGEKSVPSKPASEQIAKGKPSQAKSSSAEKPSPEKAVPGKAATSKSESDKASAKADAKSADDDEFDPVSFLMEGPKKKPSLDLDDGPATRSPMAGGPAPKSGGGRGFSLDDDGFDEEPVDKPPPTRKWGARADGSAAAAAERSMGGSTNAAKDLLARSMEESRVRASEMPEEKPRFNFDFAGFIREIGIKGFGAVFGVFVVVYGVYLGVSGMVGTKIHLPELGYVSGTVTIKGKPAAGVRVYFTPLEREIASAKNSKQKARDSVGVTNEQGEFTMYYLPEVEGAAVGPARLWLEAMDQTVVIPPSYGIGSEHRVDVVRGSNPPQKIEL